jgi:hypothetical protein
MAATEIPDTMAIHFVIPQGDQETPDRISNIILEPGKSVLSYS